MTRTQRIASIVLGLLALLPLAQQAWQGLSALSRSQAVAAGPATPTVATPTAMDQLVLVTASGVHRFTVEIAADDAARAEGLMYRQSMADDHGMLFDFKRDQPAAFWMKNTYIPLDMVFIRGDGTVVNIAENTVPMSEQGVPSAAPVRFVLEVNAGISRKIGLKPGDRVLHPLVRRAS